MLVLNGSDVLKSASMQEMVAAVEEAYRIYEENGYQMPLRTHFTIRNHSVLFMPCSTNEAAGAKIVSVFPGNKDRPVTQGAVILVDNRNGSMKTLMDGTVLTGLRTGAIGGAAAKYLAPGDAKTAGLIGTGYQGLYQLAGVCTARNIENIFLFNRTPSHIPPFIRRFKTLIPNIPVHTAKSARELAENADILITATSSATPVLPEEDLYDGKLVIGIGSYQPHMREFPDALLKNLKSIYLDSHDAAKESGDVDSRLETIPFSKIVTQKVKPDPNTLQVFKSTGMALFDLVAAETVYEKAIQLGIGQMLDF